METKREQKETFGVGRGQFRGSRKWLRMAGILLLEGSVFGSAGEGETNAVGLIFGQIKASGIPALIRLEFLTNRIAASGKNLFGSGKR